MNYLFRPALQTAVLSLILSHLHIWAPRIEIQVKLWLIWGSGRQVVRRWIYY